MTSESSSSRPPASNVCLPSPSACLRTLSASLVTHLSVIASERPRVRAHSERVQREKLYLCEHDDASSALPSTPKLIVGTPTPHMLHLWCHSCLAVDATNSGTFVRSPDSLTVAPSQSLYPQLIESHTGFDVHTHKHKHGVDNFHRDVQLTNAARQRPRYSHGNSFRLLQSPSRARAGHSRTRSPLRPRHRAPPYARVIGGAALGRPHSLQHCRAVIYPCPARIPRRNCEQMHRIHSHLRPQSRYFHHWSHTEHRPGAQRMRRSEDSSVRLLAPVIQAGAWSCCIASTHTTPRAAPSRCRMP